MADLDNEINANIINNAYSGSGHPRKDQLLNFLEEVASDINVLNAAIGATTASSDVTYLNKQWSDYIDIAAVGLNASDSTLIAETSEMVAHIVTAQSDLKLTSDYVVKNASDLKLVSDLQVTVASDLVLVSDYAIVNFSDLKLTSDYVVKNASDLKLTSDYVVKNASDLKLTSDYVVKNASDLKLVSDAQVLLGTTTPSDLDYLESELMNAIPGLSASTMLAVASEIGQTVSNFNVLESELFAQIHGATASSIAASVSEIAQTISNFNVLESELFAQIHGATASSITASVSEIAQTISNFNVLESTLFAKIAGATASSILATVSVLAYTVSDTLSQKSDVAYLKADLTDNVKSNITHLEGELSDLRGALAAAQVVFASDYAVMSDSATSDLWQTLSDILTLLSNYLISD